MLRKGEPTDSRRLGGQAVVISIMLALTGMVMVLSATSISAQAEHLSSYAYFQKQALRTLVGLVIMLVASRLDYHLMRRISLVALLVSLFLMLICLIPGTYSIAPIIGGARRWVHLGSLTFQPSELVKFFLICWAAGFLVARNNRIGRFSGGFVPYLLIVGFFCLLIVKQPDLSMALVVFSLSIILGYVGGIRLTHLLLLGVCLTPFVTYKFVMKVGYRSERISSFIMGEDDKSGGGYQAYQSKLALGSGGLAGVGLGQSRQKYFFLPAAHTDFIFSIIGEELGFVGGALVIAAFCWLAFVGIRIARGAPDLYGFLLAGGLTLSLLFSALINLAVATGLAPTTGLTLPFLSFGGTSLFTSFWAIGILNNISRSTEGEPA
ncbi:putative lipid II flippase FtsW [bacterium]|nr:putative lipid II flippase FtsW [bacterium]